MTHEEKRAWIMLVVTVAAYATYVITIVSRTNGRPLHDVAYVGPLSWTIGGSIVAAIVAEIVVGIGSGIVTGIRNCVETGIANPKPAFAKDVRDKEIGRFGEYTGQSFVVIGAIAAMVMAAAGWDGFWIANVIYLCFVLSSILGSITKIVLYHWDFREC